MAWRVLFHVTTMVDCRDLQFEENNSRKKNVTGGFGGTQLRVAKLVTEEAATDSGTYQG